MPREFWANWNMDERAVWQLEQGMVSQRNAVEQQSLKTQSGPWQAQTSNEDVRPGRSR